MPVSQGNEVQTLTVTASGGTYALTYSGQKTSEIAFDADAAAIEAALIALSNIGASDVDVTGTGPYTITFQGTLSGTDVPALVPDNTNATGGTAAITTATPGSAVAAEDVYVAAPTSNDSKAMAEYLKGATVPGGSTRISRKDYYELG